MKQFSILLALCFLAACASTPVKLPAEGKIQRIGVVAILGENAGLKYVGETVFTNKYSERRVTEWNISDNAQRTLSEALRKYNRYLITQLQPTSNVVRLVTVEYRAESTVKPLKPQIRAIAEQHGLDLVVLAVRSGPTEPGFWREIPRYLADIRGYGISREKSFPFPPSTWTYLSFEVLVMDGRSLDIVGSTPVFAYERAPNEFWIESGADWSSSTSILIRDSLYKTLHQELLDALKRLALIK